MQNNNAIDPVLDEIIKRIPPVESQAQYDTYTQLQYLIQFAKKTKLYDAADLIENLLKRFPPKSNMTLKD